MYGHGSANETANSATFDLYLASFHGGPSYTAIGNTISSDPSQFATISEGLHFGTMGTYHGHLALLLNGGGMVTTSVPNPNPNSPYFGEYAASGVWVHIGNTGRVNMWTSDGRAISAGCQTLWHGSPESYDYFMSQMPAQTNYYLNR